MLFSRSLQLLQRQPVRATQVRSYTTEGEEKDSVAKLRKDMQESLDAFEKTRLPDIPSKDAILRQRDSQKADYKVLHDTINSTETDYDPFDKDFYALSPAQQDAVRTWRSAYDAQIAPLSDKHGSALSRGLARVNTLIAEADAPMQEPVVVAITGAAGNIGYSALFRLASGGVFGPKVPVVLRLLELPGALGALEGVVMELNDCAFPTLKSVVTTSDAEEAFSGVDYALLVGAQPRTKGMERGDLLSANAEIFSAQGKALKKSKGADTRVIVVGNPANTNALIASANASTVPAKNFVAMTRLDHNRGLAQIAAKASVEVDEIDRFVILGNHSATQFPDVTHAVINKNGNWQEASSLLDAQWLSGNFIPTVQKRGAEIIAARGASSAASAGSSALDQLRDWHFGTNNKWTSAAVVSSGEYGVEAGLFYSYPVVFNSEKEWDIVRHLPITPAAAKLMEATHQELIAERDAISHLLPK